jgi:hypothetical protein
MKSDSKKQINKLIVKNSKQNLTDKKVSKDKQLIAEIPHELHTEIKILATRQNITIKEIVVIALLKYIENQRVA